MKPLLTIWTKPGATFEFLEKKEDNEKGLTLCILVFLLTLAWTLPGIIAAAYSVGDTGIQSVMAVTILTGLVGVLFFKYIYVPILLIIGRLFKGEATRFQVEIVVAYSLIPSLLNLIIFPILLSITSLQYSLNTLSYKNYLILIVIGIFVMRSQVIGLAKYNKYGLRYSLLNIILAVSSLGMAYLLIDMIRSEYFF
jgi:hypothetical protein